MTITFPKLEKWQKDVFSYLKLGGKDWYVVKSIRQCGKSVLAEILLIYSAFKTPCSVSLSVSPVVSQSRKMYEDILRIASKLVYKSNGSTLEIIFFNGSKIIFRSAEQGDSIRGITVKGSGILVVDEAAYIQDDIFYSVLVPTTNVYRAPIFVFSTPKFKNGFFYNLYIRGLDSNTSNGVVSFDWTKYDLSKYLPDDMLELYRQQMPKQSFAAEFLGEFVDADGSVFTDFKKNVRDFKVDYEEPIYIGIDWGTGTGNDNTAITIGQIQYNNIIILDQIAFNDKNTKQTINYIESIIKSYVNKGVKEINIVAEKNSIGNVYYQLLVDKIDELETAYDEKGKEVDINTQTFNTTNKSKEDIIKKTITLLEQDRLFIPDIEELVLEMSQYECKVNRNGLLTYNAPSGLHDDRVMSLCILTGKMNRYLDD